MSVNFNVHAYMICVLLLRCKYYYLLIGPTSLVIKTFKSLKTRTKTFGQGLEIKTKTLTKDLETKTKTSCKETLQKGLESNRERQKCQVQ